MKRLLFKVPLYLVLALTITNLLAVGAGVLTYQRLSDEAVIAQVWFEELGEQHYRAHLVSVDLPGAGKSFEIKGDQWQLDAWFLKMKPWANVLGFDAMYRLDRLQGRYRDVRQQNANPPLAHDLSPGQSGWLAAFMDSWDWMVFIADAEYGSATFTMIKTDTLYTVTRSQSGLLTREQASR